MNDALTLLAQMRAVEISMEISDQIKDRKSPLLGVLKLARTQAAVALADLATVDPDNPKAVRALQNEVARFTSLVEWIGRLVLEGNDADFEVTEAEQAQLAALIPTPDDMQEMQSLGIVRDHDDQ